MEGFSDTVATAVREMMPSVLGEDASRIEYLWQKLYREKFYMTTGGAIFMSALAVRVKRGRREVDVETATEAHLGRRTRGWRLGTETQSFILWTTVPSVRTSSASLFPHPSYHPLIAS